MKKFFSFALAVFLILTAVNFAEAAKDKPEKIKFDNKRLKKLELTESPVKDNLLFIIRDDPKEITIFGGATATQEQMSRFIKKNNPKAKLNCSIDELVKIYYDEAGLEGIRPDLAMCQAIKETGFWNYGGDVDPKQNNYCGLGATGNKEPGASFETPRLGARAHLQHLLSYATTRPPKTAIADPRYMLIARFKPEIFGKIKTWTGLNGVWAVPGKNYGQDIIKLWKQSLMPNFDDKSLEEANIAVAQDSSSADAYAKRGLIHFERGELFAAEEDFLKADAIEPLNTDILFDLAVIQEKNNHLDAAIRTYSRLLEIEPTSENGYYNRGRLKLAQNNFDGAIEDFEKTLELEDRFVDALNEIAIAQFRQKKYEDALKTIRKAADVNTTNEIINANKANFEACLKK